MNATSLPPFVRRGRAEPPVPLDHNSLVVRLKGCPDCDGRGYFLINPFAMSDGGFGGIANKTQCLTCLDAQAYWNEHRRLPQEIEPHVARALGVAPDSIRKRDPVNPNSSAAAPDGYTRASDGGAP